MSCNLPVAASALQATVQSSSLQVPPAPLRRARSGCQSCSLAAAADLWRSARGAEAAGVPYRASTLAPGAAPASAALAMACAVAVAPPVLAAGAFAASDQSWFVAAAPAEVLQLHSRSSAQPRQGPREQRILEPQYLSIQVVEV